MHVHVSLSEAQVCSQSITGPTIVYVGRVSSKHTCAGLQPEHLITGPILRHWSILQEKIGWVLRWQGDKQVKVRPDADARLPRAPSWAPCTHSILYT